MQKLTKKLAAKVLATVDAGLVIGIGTPVPGKMCVEAAVCYAYDLPHSARPPCVGAVVRRAEIVLNDRFKGSPQKRAQLLRRLSIAQLGSDQIDQVEFSIRVALVVCQEPNFVRWANNWLSGKDRTAKAAYAAENAAHAAAADTADFSKFAEQLVQILIEMKSPGTKYLYLTERN